MISACVLAYNDEKRIEKFIKALDGIDDIVVSVDEFSSDKTDKIAKKLGARVVGRSNFWHTPTQADIDRFEKRFGYKPHFTTENKFCHSGNVRNEAMSYCKNDWVIFPDSDEIVTWDLPIVKKLLPLYDQIGCEYVAAHGENGENVFGFDTVKLFKKSKHQWVGRVHETPVPVSGVRHGYCNKMRLDHYHEHRIVSPEKASRGLQAMEYAVINDYDQRTIHYLARELFYAKEWQHSIDMYKEYLNMAYWEPEVVETHIRMSQCYWELQQGDKSREHCLEAIRNNPQNAEALYLMSVYYNEPWASRWRKLAQGCTNEDVLFKSSIQLLDKLYPHD